MTRTTITTKDGRSFKGMKEGYLAYYKHPDDRWGYRIWHLPTNMGICVLFSSRQARKLVHRLGSDPDLRWDFTDPTMVDDRMPYIVKAHYHAVLYEEPFNPERQELFLKKGASP